jgi:hypothetical protein
MNTEKPQLSVWIKIGLVALLMTTGLEVRAAPATCEVVAVGGGTTVTVACGGEAAGLQTVAQVYVGGTHVNASLVGSGMARCDRPASKQGWCEREEARARSGLRGLWSDPFLSTRSPVARPLAIRRGRAA